MGSFPVPPFSVIPLMTAICTLEALGRTKTCRLRLTVLNVPIPDGTFTTPPLPPIAPRIMPFVTESVPAFTVVPLSTLRVPSENVTVALGEVIVSVSIVNVENGTGEPLIVTVYAGPTALMIAS